MSFAVSRLFATRSNHLVSRLAPSLTHISSRHGSITESQKFREIWHNTDSIDPLYEISKKPTTNRLDPTKRAHVYIMWGGVYGMTAMMVKNALQAIGQFLYKPGDVRAASTLEVALDEIPMGKCVVVQWQTSPVFIWHRNPRDVAAAEKDDNSPDLRDPQTDAERRKDPEWLIMLAICTHLGCVPVFGGGNWDGFFCPCHGSHYDKSGRIRKGPAPLNMEIPKYKFTSDGTVIIG